MSKEQNQSDKAHKRSFNLKQSPRLQKFLHRERQISVVFFWCCVIGFMALWLNRLCFEVLDFKRIVLLAILVIGLGFLLSKFIRNAHQNQQYPLWLRSLATFMTTRKHLAKIILIVLILVMSFCSAPKSFAATQIQAISGQHTHEQSVPYWAITPSFNLSFSHGKIEKHQVQQGLYGFGVALTYFVPIGQSHIGIGVAGHHNSKTVLTDEKGSQFGISQYDLDVLIKYAHKFDSSYFFTVQPGTALAFGFNDLNGAKNCFYRDIHPMVGLGNSFQLNPSWMISLDWLHYFGSKTPYLTTADMPSIDRFTLGIAYVF